MNIPQQPSMKLQHPIKQQGSSNNPQSNQQNRSQTQPPGNNNPDREIKTKKLYYKYCCNSCIHLESSNKSCVCIVPRSKRKKTIGEEGCQTCKCRGCTAEDQLVRNQQQRKRKRQKQQSRSHHEQRRSRSREKQNFNPQNGCCKKCIRALSKNRKACLCQVPKSVRKTKLPSEGCKLCGCHGCHPRDLNLNYQYSSEQYSNYQVSDYNDASEANQKNQNMNNIDQSLIGQIIVNQYNLYGPMLGLGIPQRTPGYILGRPI